MLSPYEILGMARKGIAIPEEYDDFIVSGEAIGYNGEGHEILESNGIKYNMTELLRAYEMSEIYTEPVPEPFCPSDRPIKPYNMRGLPLQASVKMASIDLTPENPMHSKGRWQTVGRAEECIFAVGLYFYDVENIADAKLKFRDPICQDSFRDPKDYRDFCSAHDIKADLGNCCIYTQKVGEVELKNGSYICYPNFYQTKMTAFELADPTQPGHLKYIAFYIVDPAQRLVSTEIVPPQQLQWTTTTNSLDATDDAFTTKRRLEYWHANSNMVARGRFSSEINIAD
ncbi:hypothetical protein GGI17_005428 [Coemansia sp. S146]|nr:hypothetical protein GGI17_005428 [Coemansia sp. S146]